MRWSLVNTYEFPPSFLWWRHASWSELLCQWKFWNTVWYWGCTTYKRTKYSQTSLKANWATYEWIYSRPWASHSWSSQQKTGRRAPNSVHLLITNILFPALWIRKSRENCGRKENSELEQRFPSLSRSLSPHSSSTLGSAWHICLHLCKILRDPRWQCPNLISLDSRW